MKKIELVESVDELLVVLDFIEEVNVEVVFEQTGAFFPQVIL
jgi:hypothetical protein